MLKLAEGFPDYGKQGTPQSWTLNFDNLPSGMNYKPLKITLGAPERHPVQMDFTVTENLFDLQENPDMKMLKYLQDWAALAKAHNDVPRFTVDSGRKGVTVTFSKAPMLRLWFRSRRLAKVYAKKHDVSFSHMSSEQC
uniref:Uncharacterized protein n=1 Tax=Pseudomonas phage HRDY3 TaxID=3236930 RepID=A0AB39CEB0_9VIRU